jgi:hypothetical protein
MQYSLASPSYLPYVPSRIASVNRRDIQVPQAVKDVSSIYDALVEFLSLFENVLSRLGVYTRIPLTPALLNVLMKILVELLYILALATKQVMQGHFSMFVVVDMTLD